MSFQNCIDNALKEGRITPQQADDLRARYGETEEELALDYGPEAGAEAARRVFDQLKFDTMETRRRKLLQARVSGALMKSQAEFRNYRGNKDPGEFLINLIEDVGGKLGQSTVEQRRKALLGRSHAIVADLIQKFERDAVGRTRNKATLSNVVRELFGQDTGQEAARALADAWKDASEFLRKRYNAAGGHIGKLENWGLPQRHDFVAVSRAGYEAWRDSILPRLDRVRMVDAASGRVMTDGELEVALRNVYDTITQGGWNKVKPSGVTGNPSLARRHADHRFLHFKTPDDWLEYQKEFGEGDAFAAMMGHLDVMARDIAAMEILGPNPRASMVMMEQNAMKMAKVQDAKNPKLHAGDRVQSKAKQAQDMYELYQGASNIPVNQRVARGLRASRDVLTSGMLGKAVLSAITDLWTQAHARRFNGLPAWKAVGQIVHLMSPISVRTTNAVIRMGAVAEGATQVAAAQARYMGEVNSTGVARWLADTTLRWSLLSPYTQGGRWAFQMEFAGGLADRVGKSIDDLRAGDEADQAFARVLERYGLDGHWETIRHTDLYEPRKGATFLRPEDIAQRTDLAPDLADYLANRTLEMVQSETEFAVPSASLRARSTLLSSNRPGSLPGELLRSAAMFKSFPTTIAYLAASRSMAETARGGLMKGVGYYASLTIGMSMFGALAIQAKELTAGRDPRPMGSKEFALAAMLQGGGLGIFGDFLFSDQNRFGGGLGVTMSGPVVGTASSLIGLGQEAVRAATGEEHKLGRKAIDLARSVTPYSNIWYAELAFHRHLFDQLQVWADEDAERSFRRKERWRESNYGNEYWWRPGERLPDRAPDLTTVADPVPE